MQLSGELTKVSFPNLLQLVRTGALTGIISFNKDMKTGTVLVENGFPCHAETEGLQGLEALLELFLWNSGSFAFNEEDINFISACTDFELSKCTLEYILKEGMQYIDHKNFLEEIGVTPNSILKPVEKTKNLHPPEISLLDGRKSLREALGPLNLTKSMFIGTVANWIIDGLVEPFSPGAGAGPSSEKSAAASETIKLPPWVVARLHQENTDISQAIVNMVVWTDRAKIWLYQLEGDFGKMRSILETEQASSAVAAADSHIVSPAGYDEMLTFTDDMESYPECGSSAIDSDSFESDEDTGRSAPGAPLIQPLAQDSFSQGSYFSGHGGFGAPMSNLGYFGQGRSQFSSFGGMRRHSYSSDASMFSLDHRSYDKDVMSNQRHPDLPNMEVVFDSDDDL